MNDSEDKNAKIIEKIKNWQEFPFVKPLTCRKRGCNTVLEPIESNSVVVLKCPTCQAIQTDLRQAIQGFNSFRLTDKLKKIKSRYGK